MFATDSDAVPVLVSVTGCDGLVVNIRRVVKVRLGGENEATPPLAPLPASPIA